MPGPPVIVDAHTHVFNAEDLPIDGFIKQLSPAPKLLTGLVSTPLDALSQWLAEGSSKEIARIEQLLRGDEAFEALDAFEDDRWLAGSDLTADVGDGFEGLETADGPVSEAELAAEIANASVAKQRELDDWLDEWDDETPDAEGLEPADLEFLGLGKAKRALTAINRYRKALSLITRYRYLITDDVAKTYHQVGLFVPALVDFTTADDSPRTRIGDQIAAHSMVAKLACAGLLPSAPEARVHPFVGFDPHREAATTELAAWEPSAGVENRYVPYADPGTAADADRYTPGRRLSFDEARAKTIPKPAGDWNEATLDLDGVHRGLDLVRHAVEAGGFSGVKIYPPAGFLPMGNALAGGDPGRRLDAALHALYGYCEAMQVPILTHAAHSNGFEDGYDALAGPDGWKLVLQHYPDLRLSLGHFGHLHAVGNDPSNPSSDSWPVEFIRLIDEYPHVYADVGNSKLPVSTKYRDTFMKLLVSLLGDENPDDRQLRRRRRILYGSDYWMNNLAPDHDDFLTGFDDAIRDRFDEQTHEAFMGRNALRWLGITDGDDEIDTDNKNRQRLVDFYGPHDAPGWMTG